MAVESEKNEELIIKEKEPKAYFHAPDVHEMPPFRIKYDGLIDWSSLYKLIYEWFTQRGYYFEEASLKHKIPTPMGAEEEYKITGWRKTTSYMQEEINLHLHFFEMREVEVIKEGQKRNLVKARMIITFKGGVKTDYQERWSQTQFGQYLKTFYEKYIIKKDIETVWWDRLYYVIYKLHNEIKLFLDMQAKENAYYDIW